MPLEGVEYRVNLRNRALVTAMMATMVALSGCVDKGDKAGAEAPVAAEPSTTGSPEAPLPKSSPSQGPDPTPPPDKEEPLKPLVNLTSPYPPYASGDPWDRIEFNLSGPAGSWVLIFQDFPPDWDERDDMDGAGFRTKFSFQVETGPREANAVMPPPLVLFREDGINQLDLRGPLAGYVKWIPPDQPFARDYHITRGKFIPGGGHYEEPLGVVFLMGATRAWNATVKMDTRAFESTIKDVAGSPHMLLANDGITPIPVQHETWLTSEGHNGLLTIDGNFTKPGWTAFEIRNYTGLWPYWETEVMLPNGYEVPDRVQPWSFGSFHDTPGRIIGEIRYTSSQPEAMALNGVHLPWDHEAGHIPWDRQDYDLCAHNVERPPWSPCEWRS